MYLYLFLICFKREIKKTGGGTFELLLTSSQEMLLENLKDQIEPLSNEFDSAAIFFSNTKKLVFKGHFQIFTFFSIIDDVPAPASVDIQPIENSPDPEPSPKPKPARSFKKNPPKKTSIIKKKQNTQQLKNLYYKQKILNEKKQTLVLDLQIRKLKLEINNLKKYYMILFISVQKLLQLMYFALQSLHCFYCVPEQ